MKSIPETAGRRRVKTILALVLLIASTLKALEISEVLAKTTRNFFRQRPIVASASEIELLLGLWLLFARDTRTQTRCTSICFGLFATIAIYESIHAIPSCGCFGNVKVPPTITAAFDISAVIALWFTRPVLSRVEGPTETPPSRRRIAIGTSIALLATTALWTTYFLHRPTPPSNQQLETSNSLVILDPADWLNKPFPLFNDIANSAPLRHEHWLIILYHFDCDSCQQAIPNYQRLAPLATTDPTQPHIAFIAMPPAAPPGQDPVSDSPNYLHLALKPTHDWFATTPVVAALSDGQVLSATDGEHAIQPPLITNWPK